MKTERLIPKFVDSVPDELEDGVLYISMEYGTVLHKCCCGCGSEVNTPLSPASWSLKYDGKHITLSPSIGNWSFQCQSHYWIKKNKVVWAEKWTASEIFQVREQDVEDLEEHYDKKRVGKKKKTKRLRKFKFLNWLY